VILYTQERRIIIISTVRSSKEFVEYDLRHTLGFVANPRRFNGSWQFIIHEMYLMILLQWPSRERKLS
jgi:hypothetical protein